MLVICEETFRNVRVTEQEKKAICKFLKDAVYNWCEKNEDEWFSMRDLANDEDWRREPLNALRNAYDTETGASMASGWLLKEVIVTDQKRMFKTERDYRIRKYKWFKP